MVHQGDFDGVKGIYHSNAIDEVTPFEIVCAVEKINERYLIPVLEDLLDQFPFLMLAFHADNGFEDINKQVVKLLATLFLGRLARRPFTGILRNLRFLEARRVGIGLGAREACGG